jgi:hypothetical protein
VEGLISGSTSPACAGASRHAAMKTSANASACASTCRASRERSGGWAIAWIYQGTLDGNDPAHIRHMSDELHEAGAQVRGRAPQEVRCRRGEVMTWQGWPGGRPARLRAARRRGRR